MRKRLDRGAISDEVVDTALVGNTTPTPSHSIRGHQPFLTQWGDKPQYPPTTTRTCTHTHMYTFTQRDVDTYTYTYMYTYTYTHTHTHTQTQTQTQTQKRAANSEPSPEEDQVHSTGDIPDGLQMRRHWKCWSHSSQGEWVGTSGQS